MKSNAASSNDIFFGVLPCWLCSDAMASTVAQIAFETDATRRESVAAVTTLHFQHDVAVVDNDRRKAPLIALEKPLF